MPKSTAMENNNEKSDKNGDPSGFQEDSTSKKSRRPKSKSGSAKQDEEDTPIRQTEESEATTQGKEDPDKQQSSTTQMKSFAESETIQQRQDFPIGKKAGSKKKSKSKPQSDNIERKSSAGRSSKVIDDLSQVKIGFVGAGRMADCICRGLLKSEKISPKQLFVSARSTKNFDTFKSMGVTTTTRPYEIFAKLDCDVVFLCMHGFVIRNCFKMGGTRPFPFTTNYIPWKRKQVSVLSLVGGIPVNDIRVTLLNPEQTQKYQVSIHRVMLNVASAYNLGYGLLDVELDSKKCPPIVRELLQLLARIDYLDPAQMDAACALGGNGLAFVYYFITALADGGFKMGLARDRAVKLACKTVQSAALSLLESNKTPMDLRDETAGPSGPAIYGMNVMDKKDFCGGVALAVETAYKRIIELAECDMVK